jgi:hypothetical protein
MRTITFAAIALFFTVFCGSVALGAAPYRGPGGQIEAAGMIAGTFMGTVRILEASARHPELKVQAQKTLKDYLKRNEQVYTNVMRKLPVLAKANGGDAEVQRLKTELEKGLASLAEQSKRTAMAKTQTVAECKEFMDAADKGKYDLEINNNSEVGKVLR